MPQSRTRSIVTAHSFRIGAAVPASEARWDQVAKFGEFKKGDKPSRFDRETLSQIIKNFSKQENPLPGDVEHQAIHASNNGQPAPLAAKYDALALIEDGKLVAYHSQSGGSFDAVDLGDGLWAHRSELTPFGRDLLENKGYGFISPTFWTDGLNEQGEDIGYELLTVSWTVIPFLDGMAPVQLSRLSFGQAPTPGLPKEKASMDKKDLYARYGLAEDCTEEQLHAAMAKFADDADQSKQAMADTDEEKKKKDEDEDEIGAMRKIVGLGEKATLKEIHLAMAATRIDPTEMGALRARVAELEATEKKRAEDVTKQRATDLAAFAVNTGRILDEQSRRDPIIAMAASNYDAAKAFVESLRPVHPTKESVAQTFRTGVNDRTPSSDAIPGDRSAAGEQFNKLVDEHAAKHKVSVREAMRAVAKDKPELWRAAK